MKRLILLLVLFTCCSCVSSGGVRQELPRATFNITSYQFYPATIEILCDGMFAGRIKQIGARATKRLDLYRCVNVGWEVTLLASHDVWRVGGLTARPGMIVDIVLEPTLHTSKFMIRE